MTPEPSLNIQAEATPSLPKVEPRTPHPVRLSEDAARALAEDLQQRNVGEVRFTNGDRALYATGGSNYRQIPIGVVIPRTVENVIDTIAVCRNHQVPILARGGGTSLAGQCCNTAVVIDMSKYLHRILSIDPAIRRAEVEPGCVLDDLRTAAESFHLTFGPDPSTHNHCTLGGMIGNNSCGVHSVMAGRTADNVEELEILTYDGLRMRVGRTSDEELKRIVRDGGRRGEIYAGLKALRDRYADQIRARYPKIPRRVSGYNLDSLLPENGFHVAQALVGSEGTCVTVLSAGLRLVHSPPARTLLVLGYPDVYTAGDHVPEILEHRPIGLEGIDDLLIDYMKRKNMHPEDRELLPDGKGWLMVEFGGDTQAEADNRARAVMAALKKTERPPSMKLFDDRQEERMLWEIREAGLGATANVPGMPDTWEGWEDAAVPPARVGSYLRDFRKLLERYNHACALYGHFGDGCIHVRIDFDLTTRDGIAKYRQFAHDAADLVSSYGGSLSGEHGDGQSRGELLPKMFGEELIQAFREFKAIWDPEWKMNPGKVVDPYRLDENLRFGTDYRPPKLDTVFALKHDRDSFAYAAHRCVGVGECRRHFGGVMCPSYRATREEKHSTRGRSHLLFEMLRSDPLTEGWRSEAVREALDLCLACKGCKQDCPVNVDMATYKAEFYAHYYQGRLRPREAYSMGLIYWWARAASLMPGVANFVGQTRGLSDIAKRLGGIAPERTLPRFAKETFRTWHRRREPRNIDRPKIVLWPDTFTNFFLTDTAKAACEVLEAAGYRVVLPKRILCCARPLYAWGMLDQAKKQLGQILETLESEVAEGTPVVGLEPACVSVLRDELIDLFPSHPTAQRLSRQSFMLSEFLEQKAQYASPPLRRKAIVQAHCHHHAAIGLKDEKTLLAKLGLDHEMLDSGCCGMAGSFGFEANHYEVAMQVGERALLPAVRKADTDTVIIANGFSCREQILQATGRKALHVAEVLKLALRQGEPSSRVEY